MITSDNNINRNTVYVVRDYMTQLWLLAIIIGLPCFLSITDTQDGKMLYQYSYLLSAILLARFIVVSRGVVINPADDTITIYGGGITPNSILDYLNPKFLAQYFMRFSYPLSEIAMVGIGDNINNNGKTVSHKLELLGSFGAVSVKFLSKTKCQECLAILAQINNMGIPISNR